MFCAWSTPGDPVRNLFETETVVAPDHSRPVGSSGLDSAPKSDAVGPFATHNAWPYAHRPNQLHQIEQHHMAVAFATASDVVPVLLAVGKHNTATGKSLEFAAQQTVLDNLIRNVVLFVGQPALVRQEDEVQSIGLRH